MRLKRFLLRYYPPGLTLECERADGSVLSKTIDLLHLTPDTDLDECISDILQQRAAAYKERRRPQIKALLQTYRTQLCTAPAQDAAHFGHGRRLPLAY